mmetsp:Transcript_10503/g.22549  ORF Transcript_10503/g.22549 Transcript_10503/m.22549 type:complete len:603 (+) Transcript_10503:2649-4457(+)
MFSRASSSTFLLSSLICWGVCPLRCTASTSAICASLRLLISSRFFTRSLRAAASAADASARFCAVLICSMVGWESEEEVAERSRSRSVTWLRSRSTSACSAAICFSSSTLRAAACSDCSLRARASSASRSVMPAELNLSRVSRNSALASSSAAACASFCTSFFTTSSASSVWRAALRAASAASCCPLLSRRASSSWRVSSDTWSLAVARSTRSAAPSCTTRVNWLSFSPSSTDMASTLDLTSSSWACSREACTASDSLIPFCFCSSSLFRRAMVCWASDNSALRVASVVRSDCTSAKLCSSLVVSCDSSLARACRATCASFSCISRSASCILRPRSASSFSLNFSSSVRAVTSCLDSVSVSLLRTRACLRMDSISEAAASARVRCSDSAFSASFTRSVSSTMLCVFCASSPLSAMISCEKATRLDSISAERDSVVRAERSVLRSAASAALARSSSSLFWLLILPRESCRLVTHCLVSLSSACAVASRAVIAASSLCSEGSPSWASVSDARSAATSASVSWNASASMCRSPRMLVAAATSECSSCRSFSSCLSAASWAAFSASTSPITPRSLSDSVVMLSRSAISLSRSVFRASICLRRASSS